MLSSFGCFLMHMAASWCPARPQPRVNDGTHHGSARSRACPRQEAGWPQPSSTATHPSWTPKSSGWGLPPAHACCSGGGRASAAEAGAAVPGPRLAVAPEQPPSPAGRVWWKIHKGTRWFTWLVAAAFIDVPEEHTFTPVHLLPSLCSTQEPPPHHGTSYLSGSSAWLHR